MSLRKIYYSIPAAWRFYARQVLYWPEDVLQQALNSKDELVPPRRLIYTGRGNFLNTGLDFCSLAIDFAKLSSNSQVLDIGSGIGRIAIPLTNLLNEKGSYHGFDIMKPGIDWCQKNISSSFTNFRFDWVDLRNDLYRERGISSLDFVFPAINSSKDLIFSISVFTHILDKELIHYLNESYRILKSGGFIIASFFVIDDKKKDNQRTENKFQFPYDRGHYFLMDDTLPTANVAYLKSHLENCFKEIGFTIIKSFSGGWKEKTDSNTQDFQDVYILQKV